MTKFNLYLNEQRSTTISEAEANAYIEKNCSNIAAYYEKNYKRIFRGVRSIADYAKVNPAKHTRKSSNLENYYTLLIDNDPAWSAFPKRSKSIICATSADVAAEYGTVYVVYPRNNAKIAVCPSSDIWNAFTFNSELDLPSFIRSLRQISKLINNPLPDDNWKDFYAALLTIEKRIRTLTDGKFNVFIRQFVYTDYAGSRLRSILNSIRTAKNVSFKQELFKLLSPQKFKIIKPGQDLPSEGNEVWTDSESILKFYSQMNE
jgi:hypothetical protein